MYFVMKNVFSTSLLSKSCWSHTFWFFHLYISCLSQIFPINCLLKQVVKTRLSSLPNSFLAPCSACLLCFSGKKILSEAGNHLKWVNLKWENPSYGRFLIIKFSINILKVSGTDPVFRKLWAISPDLIF